MVVTGATTRSKKTQKCFICGKRHYPFCKSVNAVCNVCKKKHQPFFRRKLETSHPAVDTASLQERLEGISKRNKAKFAASIVANLNRCFGSAIMCQVVTKQW